MKLSPEVLREVASYLRRVTPLDHDEADRIFHIVHVFEQHEEPTDEG